RLKTGRTILDFRLPVADAADLPQDQGTGRIEAPAANQEVGRFKALTATRGRVDAEIRKQAVLGRNRRQHGSGESFEPSAADRLMRRVYENPRVAIKRCAYLLLLPNKGKDPLDHLQIGDHAVFAGTIETLKRFRAGIELLQRSFR